MNTKSPKYPSDIDMGNRIALPMECAEVGKVVQSMFVAGNHNDGGHTTAAVGAGAVTSRVVFSDMRDLIL